MTKPLKIKPIDEHEAYLLARSDVFYMKDCSDMKKAAVPLSGGLAEARHLVESPDPKSRILIYGYNKAELDGGGLAVSVLLTERNLKVLDYLREHAPPEGLKTATTVILKETEE